MFGRRKVEMITVPPIPDLEGRTTNTASTDKQQCAIRKNLRLVVAALHSDKRILSLDEEVRNLLVKASDQVLELREILWVNQGNRAEDPLAWLDAGRLRTQTENSALAGGNKRRYQQDAFPTALRKRDIDATPLGLMRLGEVRTERSGSGDPESALRMVPLNSAFAHPTNL